MAVFKAFLWRVKADDDKLSAKYQVQEGGQVSVGGLYLE